MKKSKTIFVVLLFAGSAFAGVIPKEPLLPMDEELARFQYDKANLQFQKDLFSHINCFFIEGENSVRFGVSNIHSNKGLMIAVTSRYPGRSVALKMDNPSAGQVVEYVNNQLGLNLEPQQLTVISLSSLPNNDEAGQITFLVYKPFWEGGLLARTGKKISISKWQIENGFSVTTSYPMLSYSRFTLACVPVKSDFAPETRLPVDDRIAFIESKIQNLVLQKRLFQTQSCFVEEDGNRVSLVANALLSEGLSIAVSPINSKNYLSYHQELPPETLKSAKAFFGGSLKDLAMVTTRVLFDSSGEASYRFRVQKLLRKQDSQQYDYGLAEVTIREDSISAGFDKELFIGNIRFRFHCDPAR